MKCFLILWQDYEVRRSEVKCFFGWHGLYRRPGRASVRLSVLFLQHNGLKSLRLRVAAVPPACGNRGQVAQASSLHKKDKQIRETSRLEACATD